MAYEHTHGDHDDGTDSQPKFLGRMALTLLVLALLFAVFVAIGAMSHPAVFV